MAHSQTYICMLIHPRAKQEQTKSKGNSILANIFASLQWVWWVSQIFKFACLWGSQKLKLYRGKLWSTNNHGQKAHTHISHLATAEIWKLNVFKLNLLSAF